MEKVIYITKLYEEYCCIKMSQLKNKDNLNKYCKKI